jgi:hypothetical protein
MRRRALQHETPHDDALAGDPEAAQVAYLVNMNTAR